MQKRAQKLSSLQDKKRNFLKEACACEEVMRKVSDEEEETRVGFATLPENFGNCRIADDLEGSNQGLAGRRGKKRQLCVAVQRMFL